MRSRNPNPPDSKPGLTEEILHPNWEKELSQTANAALTYPDYYTSSFHAYDEGNLGWLPAMEVSAAARSVHARIWSDPDERAGLQGDKSLRESYHQVLRQVLSTTPDNVVDLGCSTGLSTFALQNNYPSAQVIGVDLSPYFLTVAQYVCEHAVTGYTTADSNADSGEKNDRQIRWVHAAAEATGLPENTADLVSACLGFHELPTAAARDVIAEAYRLVRPGGYFSIMDMDPECETFTKMPPYVLTLLKSTEPFLDQYLTSDIAKLLQSAGFENPQMVRNSPRHRTVIVQKPVITQNIKETA